MASRYLFIAVNAYCACAEKESLDFLRSGFDAGRVLVLVVNFAHLCALSWQMT